MARGNIGDKDFNIQFNDSLLSSKAYINPRYEGCKNTADEVDNNSFERNRLLSRLPKFGAPVEHYTNVIFRFDYIKDVSFSGLRGLSEVSTIQAYELYEFEEKQNNTFNININNTNLYIKSISPISNEILYKKHIENSFKIGYKSKIIVKDLDLQNQLKNEYTIHFNKGNIKVENPYLIWGNRIQGSGSAGSFNFGSTTDPPSKFNFVHTNLDEFPYNRSAFYEYYNYTLNNRFNVPFGVLVSSSNSLAKKTSDILEFSTSSGLWANEGWPLSSSKYGYYLDNNSNNIIVDKPYIFLSSSLNFNSNYNYYINFNSVKDYYPQSASVYYYNENDNNLNTFSEKELLVRDTHQIIDILDKRDFIYSFGVIPNINNNWVNPTTSSGELHTGSAVYYTGSLLIKSDWPFSYHYWGSQANIDTPENNNTGLDGQIFRITPSNRFLVIDLNVNEELKNSSLTNGGWIIPQTLEPQLLANISAITQRIQAIEEGATPSTPNFQGGGGSIYVQ